MPKNESLNTHPDVASKDNKSIELETLLAELEKGEKSGHVEGWLSFDKCLERLGK